MQSLEIFRSLRLEPPHERPQLSSRKMPYRFELLIPLVEGWTPHYVWQGIDEDYLIHSLWNPSAAEVKTRFVKLPSQHGFYAPQRPSFHNPLHSSAHTLRSPHPP
jgi:hypothetical protein